MVQTESDTDDTITVREVEGIPREPDGLCGGGREPDAAPPGDECSSLSDIVAAHTAEDCGGDGGMESERRHQGGWKQKQDKKERRKVIQTIDILRAKEHTKSPIPR